MPARVDRVIDELLTVEPSAEIVFTAAVTVDSYHLSNHRTHSVIFVNPIHRHYIDVVRPHRHADGRAEQTPPYLHAVG